MIKNPNRYLDCVYLDSSWLIPSWLTSLSSHLQAKFEFHHGDYEKQCLHALGRKDKAGMVMNNPSQSVFLFMDRQHLQVSHPAERLKLQTV